MDEVELDKRVARLWERGILPAARRLAARGVGFFPMGPTEEPSWYAEPPSGPDFFAREPEELARDLEQLWRQQDLPELAELAGRLAELANEYEIRQQGPEEVSPFVYVMY